MDRAPTATGAGTSGPARQRGALTWEWADTNGHRALTWLAVVGLVAGAGLAAFGLPAADLHGPLHYLGIMDPLCGATRGVRLTFLGDFPKAWLYNPAAIPLSLATLAMVLRAALGWLTGRWVNATIRWTPALRTLVLVLLISLWINQQLHAQLLLTRL